MERGRVEAFSDGVLAVAITLLVLNLRVPVGADAGRQLGKQGYSFAAYALSFAVIGVIWVNHHALFKLIDRVDRTLMFYNVLLLMSVCTIPFSTATLANYLRLGAADDNSRWAALVYGISMEGMSISFTLIFAHMIRAGLLRRPVPHAESRRALLRFGLGVLVYPFVAAVGLFSPVIMYGLYALLTGFYILEQTPILPDRDRAADSSAEQLDE